jgi:cobalt-zinc-cadmium efflux system protein
LIIVAVILVSTWTVLRDSINLAIDAVPNSVDPNAVRRFLCAQPGVDGIHDLHIWGMSTTETALTVHLVMPEGGGDDTFLNTLSEEILQHYGINHITVQIEQGDPGHGCDQGH